MKKIAKYPVTILFFLFLFSYTVFDMFAPKRDHSDLENRPLEQAPPFSFSSLFRNEYTPKYEEYIEDQFFLRDSWISLKSRFEYALFKVENNGVIYGTNGYQFMGMPTINEDQIERNVNSIRAFASAYPGRVTVMVVPSSSVILADYLPAHAPFADENASLDEIISALSADTQVIDIRPTLFANNDDYIYYRTDPHWTTDGAYLAYLEYISFMQLTPFDTQSYTRIEVPDFYGTTFSRSKLFNTVPDTLVYYDLPNSAQIDGTVYGLYGLASLETRDMYAMFIHGNNGLTLVEGNGEGRCLVIKDSFANCFVPFLTANYAQIDVVDLRMFSGSVNELIAENDYDDILILYSFHIFHTDNMLIKLILDLDTA